MVLAYNLCNFGRLIVQIWKISCLQKDHSTSVYKIAQMLTTVFRTTSVFSALEVFFTTMRYINLHLTLTLTLTQQPSACENSYCNEQPQIRRIS